MGSSKNDRKRPRSEVEDAVAAAIKDQGTDATPTTKRAKVEERNSLFVRSLPPSATNETLAGFFSEHFPVKHAVVVLNQKTKESRGYGFVTFADADDAAEAQKAFDKAKWDGRNIRVDLAERRRRNATDGSGEAPATKPGKPEFEKPPKLIVRNLPWSIKTSDQLSHLFRSYGKVKFADLPQSKGKLKGFGFVTIRGGKNAEKALEAINGKEIDGRTLAVDYAVDKETWDQQQGKENQKEEAVEDDAESADGSEVFARDAAEDAAGKTKDEGLDADLENFLKNHMQNLENESDEEEDDDEADGDEQEVQAPRRKTTDNSSTVFIRNLPFTTTDEQLKGFFAHFGNIRYARVVVDRVTDKPAGTGFVCFFNASDAKACIKEAPRPKPFAAGAKQSLLLDENADPSGKYTLDGRLLQVAQAVNKEEATNLAGNSLAARNEKDKRRLYLLSEGSIGRGSSLFDLLSPAELQMRQASAAQRKKMVQSNPSLHLSLTRLAVRNIPRDFGAKELKELARKAVVGFAKDVNAGRRQPLSKEENARDGKDAKEKDQERRRKGKGIVRQAKIVFESSQGSKVPEKSGAGKSRGYGFIEYTSHHWALMGLRYLNGHQLQGDNGKKQRLIVEFSIENAQVVQRRRTNEQNSTQAAQAKRKAVSETHKTKDDAANETAQSKRQHRGKEGRTKASREQAAEVGDDKLGATKEEAMKQTLIARKRLMRKKKAKARGKS
ncbi:putative RNA-binding protein C4F6.14 [Tolypocladium ophioglossoides CBS 100239]|uniref:Putative RNA-binding protein C4F6.14 n=1 Tax=Tolypocladium ophioglossoides (strain CBS 100239) TaxID=1163406 RepID=A0A0L0NBP8_TOLOC|nr:putative RNA-binding protein C4F6.14 [Tolypocladium ophioglossoides CBS 100239]